MSRILSSLVPAADMSQNRSVVWLQLIRIRVVTTPLMVVVADHTIYNRYELWFSAGVASTCASHHNNLMKIITYDHFASVKSVAGKTIHFVVAVSRVVFYIFLFFSRWCNSLRTAGIFITFAQFACFTVAILTF